MKEDKYTCGSYDSGYCYQLGRPLTDKEDDVCEYYCCMMSDNEKSVEQGEAPKNAPQPQGDGFMNVPTGIDEELPFN